MLKLRAVRPPLETRSSSGLRVATGGATAPALDQCAPEVALELDCKLDSINEPLERYFDQPEQDLKVGRFGEERQ